MDSVNICETILNKKLDNYGTNFDNFAASGELLVSITLSEYRKLVTNNATREADIKNAEKDKYERNEENKNLKAQIAALKAENYELKKQLENNTKEDDDNDNE